jgi:hypothetical protein
MNDATSPRSFLPGYWFSRNPDKAWGEKFFLGFIPVWFVYNIVVQKMGWLDTGNFWNITQNLLMWLPYCVLLPWFLRRNSGIPWHRSYWFKFNLFIFWWVVLCTYFHTEYFFDVLGMRYRFPEVTLYLDSALCGPDEATALAGHKKIPPSMYFNATAFFIVYHASAVVLMRRIRTMTLGWARVFRAIVAASATRRFKAAPAGMARCACTRRNCVGLCFCASSPWRRWRILCFSEAEKVIRPAAIFILGGWLFRRGPTRHAASLARSRHLHH